MNVIEETVGQRAGQPFVDRRKALLDASCGTSFFHDPFGIAELDRVINEVSRAKKAGVSLRAWVPACGSGEEPYTIAMLLFEAQERSLPHSIQIFATDLQASSLVTARAAKYAPEVRVDVSPTRIERFFERDAQGLRISKRIRDSVVFSVHDLEHDPPFSRLDLVVCRNLRGISDPEVRSNLSRLFHYALLPGGCLVVEAGENWPSDELFARESSVVFRRLDSGNDPRSLRSRIIKGPAPAEAPDNLGRGISRLAIETSLLDRYAPTCIVFDAEARIVRLFGRVDDVLEPPSGVPSRDLMEMIRPELKVELRAFVRRALTEQKLARRRVEWGAGGSRRTFELAVEPLPGTWRDGTLWVLLVEEDKPKASVLYLKPPAAAGVESPIDRLERELGEARDELERTRRDFVLANEQLRVSNEELLCANEELAATNEELETAKEMLELTNRDAEHLNEELERRLVELGRVNGDLNNLLENTQLATVFLDDELKLRSFTPAIQDLFRFMDADRGRPFADVTQRFDYPPLVLEVGDVLQGAAAKEAQIQTHDGRWFLMRILPYRSLEGRTEGVVVTFADISAVKEAELEVERLRRELEIQVRRLNALLEVVPVGIGFYDGGERALRLNRAGAELLGQEGEAPPANDADPLPYTWRPNEQSSAAEQELWKSVTSNRRLEGVEVELGSSSVPTRNLVTRSVPLRNEQGESYAQVSALVDVSESKRHVRQAMARERQQALIAEIGLRALESRFVDELINQSLPLIAEATTADLAEFGQLDEQGEGLRWIGALGFEHEGAAVEPLAADFEATLSRPSAKPSDVNEPFSERLSRERVRVGLRVPIWVDARKPYGVLGIYCRSQHEFDSQDRAFLTAVAHVLTAAIQRRVVDQAIASAHEAAALARAHEQSRRTERLASLGIFAAGIAHEVNNPLTNIALAAEYAQKTREPARLEHLLATIAKNTDRCGRIVESVLSFARDETTRKWPNSINGVLRRSAELLRTSVDASRIELLLDLSEPSPYVECNPIELEQVFVNLMKNAVEACPGKCRVTVRSRCERGKVRIELADDGPGIAAEDRAHIFDPFFSTRRNAGGTGLGLSITHRILSSHGGSIALASEVQHGTRFDIELPEVLPTEEG